MLMKLPIRPDKKTSVISQLVYGVATDYAKFNGNGHTFTGLRGASLFDKFSFVDFHDINFNDSSNIQDASTSRYVSLIAKQSYHSKFSDIYFNNVSLQGAFNVGFVVGDDGFIGSNGAAKRETGSQFSRIQVTNGSVVNGSKAAGNSSCYAGFITGRAYNSDFEDIYVQGRLTSFRTACGGVVGAITNSARLNRCISNVDVICGNAAGNKTLFC